MTVGELIEELGKFPENYQVICECLDSYSHYVFIDGAVVNDKTKQVELYEL